MKSKLVIVAIIFLSQISVAQSFNYKAIILDASGNAVSNELITVQFSILEDATSVYEEIHTPTTNVNGLIVLEMGSGTPQSGVFSEIDWGSRNHFLNVQVDTGNGLQDLATTSLATVPYAEHARLANNALNVSGLEQIDEGNGNGWRLVSRNAANYDNIGFNAVDFSFVNDPNLGLGATGNYAFSLGHNGSATGEHSLSFGNQNFSLNNYAVAIGNNNVVTGLNSTAIGAINQVEGDYAIAMGLQNQASADYAVAFGNASIASGNYSFAFGNGARASATNAIAMGEDALAIVSDAIALGNNATASAGSAFAVGLNAEASGTGSISLGLNTEALGLSAISLGTGTVSSGLASVALGRNSMATGAASVAIGSSNSSPGTGSVAVGNDVQAFSNYSIAMGRNVFSGGENSIAMGRDANTSGFNAIAIGRDVTATEDYAVAIGRNVESDGSNAISLGEDVSALNANAMALGFNSEALGLQSTTFGRGLIAQGVGQVVVGSFNEAVGTFPNSGAPLSTEPVFIVGSGGNDTSRDNALTVLFNENVGIGTDTPQERLHIEGRLRIGTETIEDTGNNRLSFNAGLLPDSDSGFALGNSGFRWSSVWAVDGTINTSDRRDKENIVELTYGLDDVLKLKPVSFNWKKRPEAGAKLGLIAQEINEIIPEVVMTEEIVYSEENNTSYDKKPLDRMGVYYSDLIPVLIKAIQEQQEVIETLESSIDRRDSEVLELQNDIAELKAIVFKELSTKNPYSAMKE